jgi:UrcA family protein
MNKLRLFAVITSCALVGPVCTLPAAHAASPDVVVSYRDLDLSSAADMHVLYHRLHLAADRVCIDVPSIELTRHAAYRRCVQAALDHAVASVHSPALSSIHRWAALGPEKLAETTR